MAGESVALACARLDVEVSLERSAMVRDVIVVDVVRAINLFLELIQQKSIRWCADGAEPQGVASRWMAIHVPHA